MIEPTRRQLLGGILSLVAYSALPKSLAAAQSRIQSIPILRGDGVHDDYPALQAMFDEKPFLVENDFLGTAEEGYLQNGAFRLSKCLVVAENSGPWTIENCTFRLDSYLSEGPVLAMKQNHSNTVVSGLEVDSTNRHRVILHD